MEADNSKDSKLEEDMLGVKRERDSDKPKPGSDSSEEKEGNTVQKNGTVNIIHTEEVKLGVKEANADKINEKVNNILAEEDMLGVKRERDSDKPKQGSDSSEEKETNTEKPVEKDDSDNDEEHMCRYCFGGEEDGPLISPCACKGGQKYVHLSCLRQWQRMVLVSQPTHPAFYEDDVRHHKCNVCTSSFTCPPPTRYELMSTFTGSELAALISVGAVIGSHKDFSDDLEHQIQAIPMLKRNYEHWIRGSYLITGVEQDDDKVRIPCSSKSSLEAFKQLFDKELSIKIGDKKFKVAAAGSLKGTKDENLDTAFKALDAPAVIVLKAQQPSDFGDDHVTAVNLTRKLASAPKPKEVESALKAVAEKYPEAMKTEITHYRGGPCETNTLVTCVVPVGNGQGWKIVKNIKDAIRIAYAYVHDTKTVSSEGASDPKESPPEFGRAQTVRLKGLKSCKELNGSLGLTLRYDAGRWLVRLANGTGKKVKPVNLEPLSTRHGRVMCFWGDARWSRTQLLGEIARGSWGLCAANITDIIAPIEERWNGLYERLAFAPKSAMSEEYMHRQMNAIREHRMVPVVGAQNNAETSGSTDSAGDSGEGSSNDADDGVVVPADVLVESLSPPSEEA